MLNKEPGVVCQQLATPIMRLKPGVLHPAEQLVELVVLLLGVGVFKPVQPQQQTQTVPKQQHPLHGLVNTSYLWYNFCMDEVEITEFKSEKPERIFALVTDGEVFHKWYVEENYDNPQMAALLYGLQSGPIVVDITDKNYNEIDFGWTYDGNSFTPPDSEVDDE